MFWKKEHRDTMLDLVQVLQNGKGRNILILYPPEQALQSTICLSPPRGLGCSPDDGKAVHVHSDGSWYFWDETWMDEIGPYATKEECDKSVKAYFEQL